MSDLHHVFAFYLPAVESIRRPAIQMELGNLDATAPTKVATEADPMSAVAKAVQLRQAQGARVTVLGAVRDLVPPEEHIPEALWHQSILHVLEDAGIAFAPLDASKRKISRLKGGSDASIVRAYHHARLVLQDEMERRLTKQVIGRPPYGYNNVDGILQLNPEYADAIREVIQCIRERWSPSTIEDHMKRHFPTEYKIHKKSGKRIKSKQFWSVQKIRRIHQRLCLYTLGEYTGRDGKTYIDRSLAFLPAEWAELKWPTESESPSKEAS